MTNPIARDPIYRRRGFDPEIIEQCVRWYISYRLSYRDLARGCTGTGLEGPFDRTACTGVSPRLQSTLAAPALPGIDAINRVAPERQSFRLLPQVRRDNA